MTEDNRGELIENSKEANKNGKVLSDDVIIESSCLQGSPTCCAAYPPADNSGTFFAQSRASSGSRRLFSWNISSFKRLS